jgi:hypothetical protein
MAYTTIDDPSAHFQTKLYVGTAGLSIPVTHTNDGNSDLQPDLIWGKDRDTTYGYYLCDSSRGRSKYLYSDSVSAEVTTAAAGNDIVSFDTDGFKVGAPSASNSTNAGTTNKVAWQWKANGGTTSSFTESGNNPGGTIQTNSTAGFSIISYTGTGGPGNIAHGLPSAPEWIIFKNRGTTNVWACWHVALGDDYKIVLNSTDGKDADGSFMNSTLPDATNIRVGDSNNPNTNADTGTYICYAWSPIAGYSKFGKYVGNGNADGPFIYTGFKPAYILFKKSSDSGDNWMVYDDKRSDSNGNVVDRALRPNSDAAEYDNANANIDILSNGFKLRSSFGWVNQSSHTYIYMAWAENPFVTSTGIPTTAR